MSTEVTAAARQPSRREIIIDAVPIFDTARFEHMQRIATVMAHMSLIPDTLAFEKNEAGRQVALPIETVTANCFLIVNQATRWGMDPFAVAQCVSVVHGKLCHEGKLIAAVLEAKLGVELEYEISGEGDDMKVIVTGAINGHPVLDSRGRPKIVEGTVDEWKTEGRGSPWAARGGRPRMLRYRGAREWGRQHAPGLMLGVYGDDELLDMADDARARRATPVNQTSSDDRPVLSRLAGEGNGRATYRADRERPAEDQSGSADAGDPNSEETKGGANEVAETEQDQTRLADSSGAENRSAEATQQSGETDGSSVTESNETKASATPAPADAGTSAAVPGASSQPDLLSGTSPAGGKAEPSPPGSAGGADGTRGNEQPSASDRLKSYNKALSGIENGGPPKLGKQSDAWSTKHGKFAGPDEKKRGEIYALHLKRITGEVDMAACQKQVEGIITR